MAGRTPVGKARLNRGEAARRSPRPPKETPAALGRQDRRRRQQAGGLRTRPVPDPEPDTTMTAREDQSMTRTITALFDTPAEAERAAQDLATNIGGVRGEVYDTKRSGELSRLSIPGEDRATFDEGIRRGGAILHAQVPDHQFEAAADVLERDGAVDIDEREAAWRKEGWTGGVASQPTATTGSTGSAQTGGEERIPVVEERLSVGKRETEHGRVRIRSYVVETPVEERVALREERVQVERRPVDRPVAAGDDAFRERTVEATESAEEAVVSKEARVTEEVVVRKQAEERTETVSDTVRRTEVEVEDGRGRAGATERRDKV
jgi:uncharacterized protein (TIGR02271 family)